MGIKQTIFIVLLMPIFLSAYTKLPTEVGQEIITFTLFNYDNLIADSYENSAKSYLKHLADLLSKATKISAEEYLKILASPELCTDDFPVTYMLRLNRKTREISGFYFVDTDD